MPISGNQDSRDRKFPGPAPSLGPSGVVFRVRNPKHQTPTPKPLYTLKPVLFAIELRPERGMLAVHR